MEEISKKYTIGSKYVIWIQGESDAKYGSDIIYYIDDVHYSQEGLNILRKYLSENIYKYHTTKEDISIDDTIDLSEARKYGLELEKIHKQFI